MNLENSTNTHSHMDMRKLTLVKMETPGFPDADLSYAAYPDGSTAIGASPTKMQAEIVKRWNAHQELRDNLQGLLTAARKAAAHAEHSPDYADEDAHYVGEWIDSASQFLETLKSTK